jgi:hypothetical protein
METSEYFVAPDGLIYWGGNIVATFYPIVGVCEFSCFGIVNTKTLLIAFMTDEIRPISLN